MATTSTTTAPAGSYSFTSGGQTFIASPTASTTAAQKAAVASDSRYTPVAAGTSYTPAGKSFTGTVNYNPATGESTPISVADLTKITEALKQPEPKPVVNPMIDVSGANSLMGVTGQPETVKTTTDQFTTDLDMAASKFKEIVGEQPSATELYERREREMGIQQKQEEVNRYQTQLNQIVNDAQAKQIALVGQGRGIPEVIIGGQQAQVAREAAIQALPVQALLASAQGNLTFALNRLDKLAELEITDANNRYQQRKELFSFAFNYANEQQKSRLALAEKATDRAWEREKMNINSRNEWASAALKAGDKDAFNSIISLDTKSANFGTKLMSSLSTLNKETISSTVQAKTLERIKETVNLANHTALDAAVGPNVFARWSPLQWLTGGRDEFVAGIEQLRGELTLDNLINAKAQGATFGALSDTELKMLSSSATKLGTWAIEDDGKVIGYQVNEGAFKKELDKINNFAKLDYIRKGGDPRELANTSVMEDGTIWSMNSDGSLTQLQ